MRWVTQRSMLSSSRLLRALTSRWREEALQHRKHVFVEKPLATESSQGTELFDIAARQRLTLMVGHVFVYNPAIRKVKEYLDARHLGKVYYVSMVRTNLGPIRLDVNAAWDLAAHDLSIANYWLDAQPLSVSAIGGTWINQGIEDAIFATLRYPQGVLVNLHASWLNPRKTRDITVVGERRMLTFDDMNLNEPLCIYDKQVTDVRTRPVYVDSFASFRASVRKGAYYGSEGATGRASGVGVCALYRMHCYGEATIHRWAGRDRRGARTRGNAAFDPCRRPRRASGTVMLIIWRRIH